MFIELLKEIAQKGIEISIIDGKLTYSGPEENITDEFLIKLKENKARLIKHYWTLKNTNMMAFNPQGNLPPFVLVQGEEANYFIRDSLHEDQPFYGFFHLGSEGEPVLPRTVEEFAAEYIKELMKVAPTGPYLLGGFSFGGIIAYEMALQLKKMNYQVEMLLMIDCVNPDYKGEIYRNFYQNYLKKFILSPAKHIIKGIYVMSIARLNIVMKKPVKLAIRKSYILQNYTNALSKYHPRKYDGDIILLRADENVCDNPKLGWDLLVDNTIEVIDFNCNHLEMIKNPVNAKLLGEIVVKRVLTVQKNYSEKLRVKKIA